MHSNALFLTLLAITGIEALPLTGIFASYLHNSTRGLQFTVRSTTGAQDTPLTFFRPTTTFKPIIGSTQPILIPSFSTPRTRSTTRYTNTGDPVSAFFQARQTGTAAVTEVEEVHATMIHDFTRHESSPTAISPRRVLVGSRGFEVGNGVEAHGEFDERSAFDAKGERRDASTHVPAGQLGTFGGGGGVPPVAARDPGYAGGSNSIPPQLAEDSGSGESEE